MAKIRKIGDIEEYARIVTGLREKIVASVLVLDKIRQEVKDGLRQPDSEMEAAEVKHLKELRGALILHLHSLNEMLGDD